MGATTRANEGLPFPTVTIKMTTHFRVPSAVDLHHGHFSGRPRPPRPSPRPAPRQLRPLPRRATPATCAVALLTTARRSVLSVLEIAGLGPASGLLSKDLRSDTPLPPRALAPAPLYCLVLLSPSGLDPSREKTDESDTFCLAGSFVSGSMAVAPSMMALRRALYSACVMKPSSKISCRLRSAVLTWLAIPSGAARRRPPTACL
mmetsp:Transcript_18086/g.54543  ORF Transcript_18086/g.54543 Transcript_18086/m.54543 type:complete len:204 (-) Transcript_18086:37-648(-)